MPVEKKLLIVSAQKRTVIKEVITIFIVMQRGLLFLQKNYKKEKLTSCREKQTLPHLYFNKIFAPLI